MKKGRNEKSRQKRKKRTTSHFVRILPAWTTTTRSFFWDLCRDISVFSRSTWLTIRAQCFPIIWVVSPDGTIFAQSRVRGVDVTACSAHASCRAQMFGFIASIVINPSSSGTILAWRRFGSVTKFTCTTNITLGAAYKYYYKTWIIAHAIFRATSWTGHAGRLCSVPIPSGSAKPASTGSKAARVIRSRTCSALRDTCPHVLWLVLSFVALLAHTAASLTSASITVQTYTATFTASFARLPLAGISVFACDAINAWCLSPLRLILPTKARLACGIPLYILTRAAVFAHGCTRSIAISKRDDSALGQQEI